MLQQVYVYYGCHSSLYSLNGLFRKGDFGPFGTRNADYSMAKIIYLSYAIEQRTIIGINHEISNLRLHTAEEKLNSGRFLVAYGKPRILTVTTEGLGYGKRVPVGTRDRDDVVCEPGENSILSFKKKIEIMGRRVRKE